MELNGPVGKVAVCVSTQTVESVADAAKAVALPQVTVPELCAVKAPVVAETLLTVIDDAPSADAVRVNATVSESSAGTNVIPFVKSTPLVFETVPEEPTAVAAVIDAFVTVIFTVVVSYTS
jgi:hypothetical protein